MKTIKIKRVYDIAEKSDGYRVLVDRIWPRGLKKEKAALDLWEKDIAPSNELRKWFNHEPNKWDEFQQRYAKELEKKPELLKNFINEIEGKSATFLFAAKETKFNNAIALSNILQNSMKLKQL